MSNVTDGLAAWLETLCRRYAAPSPRRGLPGAYAPGYNSVAATRLGAYAPGYNSVAATRLGAYAPGYNSVAATRLGACASGALCFGLLAAVLFSGIEARAADKPSAAPWNVLLFTIDSCNASRLSLYGNPIPTTPNLDRWARTSTVFEQAYSVSAWTAPGLVSLLSGLLPGAHGVDSRDRHANEDLPSLLKVFAAAGYRVPNLNFFTFVPYYRNLGLPPVDNTYFSSAEGEELINYLESNTGAPFFVWYHTTKVHQPYNPPPDALKKMVALQPGQLKPVRPGQPAVAGGGMQPQDDPIAPAGGFGSPAIEAARQGAIVPRGSVTFLPEDLAALRALYDAELFGMDVFFGRVLDLLRRKGIEDRTLVIVTADHGEELLEHGFVGHASTSLNAHLYDEVSRIPLIVHLPGQSRGSRVSAMVQQIDVAPTILELFGFGAPGELQGRSLTRFLPRKSSPAAGGRPRRDDARSSGKPAVKPIVMSRSGRSSVFLESVIAGNQTTQEREHIWVQGLRTSDFKYVRRLEASQTVEEMLFDLRRDPREATNVAGSKPAVVARLRQETDRMLRDNAALRKRFVGPDPAASDAPADPAQCPQIQMPQEEQTLDYAQHTGALLFQWSGQADGDYSIDYDIGIGDHHVAGRYEVRGNYQILGPFPPELWISLKAWNPFKVRVAYRGGMCWSEWRTFRF